MRLGEAAVDPVVVDVAKSADRSDADERRHGDEQERDACMDRCSQQNHSESCTPAAVKHLAPLRLSIG